MSYLDETNRNKCGEPRVSVSRNPKFTVSVQPCVQSFVHSASSSWGLTPSAPGHGSWPVILQDVKYTEYLFHGTDLWDGEAGGNGVARGQW